MCCNIAALFILFIVISIICPFNHNYVLSVWHKSSVHILTTICLDLLMCIVVTEVSFSIFIGYILWYFAGDMSSHATCPVCSFTEPCCYHCCLLCDVWHTTSIYSQRLAVLSVLHWGSEWHQSCKTSHFGMMCSFHFTRGKLSCTFPLCLCCFDLKFTCNLSLCPRLFHGTSFFCLNSVFRTLHHLAWDQVHVLFGVVIKTHFEMRLRNHGLIFALVTCFPKLFLTWTLP